MALIRRTITRASIALLMVLWGTFVSQFERESTQTCSNWKPVLPGCLGIALALYVFMADAIEVADQGVEALRAMLPVRFNWPLFSVALALMSVPVVDAGRTISRRPGYPAADGLT